MLPPPDPWPISRWSERALAWRAVGRSGTSQALICPRSVGVYIQPGLAHLTGWNRRLRQSRSHRRRHRHQRTLRQNYGKPQSSRPVFHRRSRRRNRPSRRLQFPVGLVLRWSGRTGDVSESNRFLPVLFRRRNGPVVTRGHASKAVTLRFISHRSRPGCRRLYRGRNQVA
jgi:hypothetical protein